MERRIWDERWLVDRCRRRMTKTGRRELAAVSDGDAMLSRLPDSKSEKRRADRPRLAVD